MNKPINAWAVLDVGGGIRHPSVSIFDTKKEAQEEADDLNRLPDPEGVKDPKNHIAEVEIRIKKI